MRALLLASLLLAVPVAAPAKEGAGQCLWRTIPQRVRDQTVLVYGREGRPAFLATMAGMGDRLTPEALGACLGSAPTDEAIAPVADAFNAYALETAATETLARRAGRPVSAVQALWPGLTAEQREQFRKIADGGELEIDGLQTLREAARSIGIAPETKTVGDQRFEDILTLFYASASLELAEARF